MSRDRADIRHDRRGIRPTAATFARTGVTSGKTATTETKLTRVGEGGEETRRFFSLEELRKLSFRPSKANGEGPGVVCSARPCHTDCAVPKQQDWGKTLFRER